MSLRSKKNQYKDSILSSNIQNDKNDNDKKTKNDSIFEGSNRNSSFINKNSKEKKVSLLENYDSQLNSKLNNINENKEITQLPYLTIDCIFNKQNTWINLQNRENSLNIIYDIWDENLWHPLNYYIHEVKKSEKHEGKERGSSNESRRYGQRAHQGSDLSKANTSYNTLINMEDIPAFFSIKDLIKPFPEEKFKTIQKNILDILKEGIRDLRQKENKKTKFANVK